MKRRQLEITLEAAGKPAEQWESSDGTRVLVLPHGGRVLGLFSPDNEENFFWTHPALANKESAEAFYRGNQWHNSGGDRTWVAPEVDFFFPDFPDLRRYWQQRELDPGQYQAARSNGILTWSTRARLTLSRTKGAVDVEITKSLFPALNPLRYEANAGLKSVSYAGYTLQTKLRVLGSAPSAIGLWQLVQMPHAGEMLIPTFSRSEPKLCMGAIADEDLPVSDRLVRYKMRAKGEHKLTMRAATITGRAGYIYAEGAASALVIRNFRVNPSGEYVDVPWSETNDFGYSFQACNVNGVLGEFSELEYHVAAIGGPTGAVAGVDESQLWAFRGTGEKILEIARYLLSPEV